MTCCRPRNTAYRRPETENVSDFWFISQEKWNELWQDVDAGGSKKVIAMNAIRKFDAAGRIMETDEGALAVVSCDRCSRENAEEVCKVFADGRDKACAACKRNAKSGCNASLTEKPLSLEDRVLALEEQLNAANERIQELEGGQNVLEGMIQGAIEQFAGAFTDIATIWRRLWPNSAGDDEMQA